MALRGNLKDFTLPDVFQLIAASKKTGILRIVGPDQAEGSVWFRDGDVFFAQSNWHHEKLGERLVASQKITPSALARVLQVQASDSAGRRIGQILVDEGYITAPVLEAFVQEQIQETVFDLMRWSEGDFDFELLPRLVDEDIGLTVSMENIIMEGSRRLEEWARIKRKVPSMDIVFRMATAPGEGTFEISLKPVEWNLLLLLDGTRSVAELARATGRTDFEVARIVYGLYSAGLLEVTPDDEVARLRAERLEREARRRAEEAERAAAAEPAPVWLPAPGAPPAAEPVEVVAAESAPGAPPAAEPVHPAPEPAEAREVPAFLAGAPAPPAEEDMAVLEEMIGSLLGHPAVQPVPQPLEEEAVGPVEQPPVEELRAEITPVEELEFAEAPVSESIEFLPEEPGISEAGEVATADETARAFDELVAPAAPGVAEVELEPAETEAEFGPGQVVELETVEAAEPELTPELEPEPAPELAPEPAPELAPEPAPELTLGPVEMAVEPEFAPVIPPEAEPEPTLEAEPAVEESAYAAPAEAPIREEAAEVGGAALQPFVEPEAAPEVFVEPAEVAETYVEPAVGLPLAVEGIPAEEAELLMQPVAEPASVVLGAAGEVEPRPIEVEAGAVEAGAIEIEAEVEAIEVQAEEIPPPEAIESAAEPEVGPAELESATARLPEGGEFLEAGADVALAGSLSSEISALTGAGRTRPPAVVRSLEPGAGRLHRDTAIDRDTLLKIIDGIKNL